MLKVDTKVCFFLSEELVPSGFVYPESYREFSKQELPDLEPWCFLYVGELEARYNGLLERYPSHNLVPFARREDNDDVACFDASIENNDPKVIFIHDYATPGWEHRGTCKNFLQWLEVAREESIEWKNC